MFVKSLFVVWLGILFLSLSLNSCNNNKSDINRVPSITGVLLCSNELKQDTLNWNVGLYQPFDLTKELMFNEMGGQDYVFLDGISKEKLKELFIKNVKSFGISIYIDSIQPGNYHILINSSLIYHPQSSRVAINFKGETIQEDFINPYIYKPIFISNVRISADSISQIKIDSLLEWAKPRDTYLLDLDYFKVVYSEWDKVIFRKE